MKRKIFYILLFLILLPVTAVLAQDGSYGLNEATRNSNVNSALSVSEIGIGPGTSSGFLATKTGSIIGTALSFLGVIFLLLTIAGGIMWMTAGGNTEQVAKAKKLITSAIIGLVIVFAAYALTSFIGDMLTGSGGGGVEYDGPDLNGELIT
ncbi:pilin [Patescibacteria group bacterium]|nr:pilin [Patescibacteria group bacterium]